MQLDQVTVELRPRSEWEGAELGVRMVRRDARAIYAAWFTVTLPPFVVLALLTWYNIAPTIALFAYWWLEPVADGPILRIISRRLFGEQPDWRATLRDIPALAWRNRIFLLPPYRFHFARSLAMPVTQLEGLRGPARRARARVLNQRVLNYGTGLTAAYQHLALCLYIGVILLAILLIPAHDRLDIAFRWLDSPIEAHDPVVELIGVCAMYLAQSALQPWYVGAGFGLYINCRTQLEAWDLEVAFRRIVERRALGAAAVVLLITMLLAVVPRPAIALDAGAGAPPGERYASDDMDGPESDRDIGTDDDADEDPGFAGYWEDTEVRSALETAYGREELEPWADRDTWQRLEPAASKSTPQLTALNRFFELLGRIFGYVVEFALWFLLAVLVIAVILLRKRWWPMLRGGKPVRARPVVRLADGKVTPDSIPEDLPRAVRDLWNRQQHRAALSLLYRGSVYAAVAGLGVALPASATEGHCVAAVDAQAGANQAAYFRRIVAAWTGIAYGSIDPGDDVVLPLCDEWQRHLGAPA